MVRKLPKVGRVKCQPFLKCSNHWNWALEIIFKGSVCFSYCEESSVMNWHFLLERKSLCSTPDLLQFSLFIKVETAAYN